MTRFSPLLLWCCLVQGCAGNAALNQVQDDADAAPSWFVSKSVDQGFVPECKRVDVGDTVEWTNQDPHVPADVTSLQPEGELYSPNLQGAYASWAHTFRKPGHFTYYDTQSGDPGRAIVDAYYGTVTWVGASEDAHRGAVCVSDGDEGEGACCCTDLDCTPGLVCDVANTCSAP